MTERQFEILVVEDNPADVFLLRHALQENFRRRHRLLVAEDGDEAIRFLRQEEGCFGAAPRPDLVLLDLNLPKMDGHALLSAIKSDPDLRRIPTVILSSSRSDKDVGRAYDCHANAYLNKPLEVSAYPGLIKSIEDFWFSFTALPTNLAHAAY